MTKKAFTFGLIALFLPLFSISVAHAEGSGQACLNELANDPDPAFEISCRDPKYKLRSGGGKKTITCCEKDNPKKCDLSQLECGG